MYGYSLGVDLAMIVVSKSNPAYRSQQAFIHTLVPACHPAYEHLQLVASIDRFDGTGRP